MEERSVTLYDAGAKQLDTMTLAQMFVKSGWFKDVSDVAQAVVKMQAGAEAGFGPMASLTGVYIVQGKPTWSSNLMAAAIKRSGRYNYRIRQATNEICEIEFYEGGESVGKTSFTIDEARQANLAGKDTWKNYASDMLFARALSRGCRRFCPDVFGGSVAYVPEDLANIAQEPVEQPSPVVRVEQPQPRQQARPQPQPNGNGKPKGPTPDNLRAGWDKLWAAADGLGIPLDQRPSFPMQGTTDQMIAAGRSLQAIVKQAQEARHE